MKFLNQFIQKEDALHRLQASARQLEALTRKIQAILPASARDHVVGCAPRSDLIVVFVDSAAWATQLRYVQQEILVACRHILGDRVQRIHLKVLPLEPVTGKPPAPELSKNTRRLLHGTANGITDDDLAAALLRLSDSGDQDAD